MQYADAAYEFDAPKFHDFSRLSPGDSQASKWFDDREGDGQ